MKLSLSRFLLVLLISPALWSTRPLRAASFPFANPFAPNPAETTPPPRTGTTVPEATPAALPEGLTEPGGTLWDQDTLTGDWGGQRDQLLYRGFAVTPIYQGEIFGNPSGGAGRGLIYDGVFNVGFDVDLSRVTGWSFLGLIHANGLYIHGVNLSARFVGDISGTSNIAGYNTPRVQELWYRQDFWRKRLNLKVGLIAADTEFFVSDYGALFLNGTFGAFTFVGVNLPNPPIYPIAAPGVRLYVKPVSKLYAQAGFFSGNPGGQTENKNGLDLRLRGGRDGALMFFETGYLFNQSPGDRGLTGTYKVGAFLHTGEFDSWGSQTANALRDAPLNDRGPNHGIYGVVDQELYKRGGKTVGLFARGGIAPSDVNVVNRYLDGGINFIGFVPGRPTDVVALGVARSWISSSYSRFQTKTGGAAGRPETVIEATYRLNLANWWSVQPDLQYLFNPGATDGAENALVLGCRTTFVF